MSRIASAASTPVPPAGGATVIVTVPRAPTGTVIFVSGAPVTALNPVNVRIDLAAVCVAALESTTLPA